MSESFENLQIKLFEALKEAIFRAVAKSQDINSLMRVIREHHLEENLFSHIELLDLRSLLENVTSAEARKDENSATPVQAKPVGGMLRANMPQIGQFIDGKRLSLPEILFEEYCRARFDETRWIKQNRLNWS